MSMGRADAQPVVVFVLPRFEYSGLNLSPCSDVPIIEEVPGMNTLGKGIAWVARRLGGSKQCERDSKTKYLIELKLLQGIFKIVRRNAHGSYSVRPDFRSFKAAEKKQIQRTSRMTNKPLQFVVESRVIHERGTIYSITFDVKIVGGEWVDSDGWGPFTASQPDSVIWRSQHDAGKTLAQLCHKVSRMDWSR